MSLLKEWLKLPQAKQMQLAKQYGLKWYGTTEAQLEFELLNKLPVGLLVPQGTEEVKEEPISEPDVKVEFAEEPVEEVKEVKKKKSKKK